MKRIHIVSRRYAERFEPEHENWYLISIETPGSQYGDTPNYEQYKDHFIQEFHDVERGRNGLEYFTEEHAKVLISFVENWKYNDEECNILVHCDAGISRSAAIGRFLEQFIIDANVEFTEQPHTSPNQLVRKHLMIESGLDQDYINWWYGG